MSRRLLPQLRRQVIHVEGMVRPPAVSRELREVLVQSGPVPVDHLNRLSPHMKTIQWVDERAIPGFTTSSKDERLARLADKHGCRFVASTSSLTCLYSHLFYLLTNGAGVSLTRLSHHFQAMDNSFTPAAVKPNSIFLRPHAHGRVAVDSDPGIGPVNHQILIDLGKVMELMVTKAPKEYVELTKGNVSGKPEVDSFTFLKLGNVMVRSQQDAVDFVTGKTLDIKTRATTKIRYNIENYKKHLQYRLKFLEGPNESYEREFYDMIRSVFPKYSFQMRIGQMSGALVLYHNTQEVFGYERIPLEAIDEAVFGSTEMAERVFDICASLTQELFQHIERMMPLPVHVTFWYNRVDGCMEVICAPVSNDKGWYDSKPTPSKHTLPSSSPEAASADSELDGEQGDTAEVELPVGSVKLSMRLRVEVNGQRKYRPFLLSLQDTVQVWFDMHEVSGVYAPHEMARWGDGYHPEYFVFPQQSAQA